MEEIWKEITETECHYLISNFSRVKRLARRVKSKHPKSKLRTLRERISKPQNNGCGYMQLYIKINGQRKMLYIHRLVATYFIPNPENKPEVNHIDGNKANNHVSNLEWVTLQENRTHAVKNGLIHSGEKNSNSKLTEKQVRAVLRLFRINPKVNLTQLGFKLGVSDNRLSKITRGLSWRHVWLDVNKQND